MEITTLTSGAIYYNTPYWKLLLKVSISATFLIFLLWMTNFFSNTSTNCCPATQTLTSPITTSFVLHESPLIPANQITVTFAATTDYLVNPGIGWQETKDFAHPKLPETVSYRRRQYNWALLNPTPGVFDWSPIDKDLQEAVAQGKQFSFRVYSMSGESYGDHQLPQWVVEQGAVILASGEPYYSNCVYQEKWSEFIEQMRQRYDGNPNLAWIDISGYGNFNEWSWHEQTTVVENTLDTQARKHLVDIFIGGTGTIECANSQNITQTLTYTATGFQQTQLVMPYAGIRQSTRYVASRRADIGIRHDCLGSLNHTDDLLLKIGDVIESTWRRAPIIYEFCSNPDLSVALPVLKSTHASIVHDNIGDFDTAELRDLLRFVGYRYTLKQATYTPNLAPGSTIELSTQWVNSGYAPAYPRMGEDFELSFLLIDSNNNVAQEWQSSSDLSLWMPAATITGTAPINLIKQSLELDRRLATGTYELKAAVIDRRSNKAIYLANERRDQSGRYLIGTVTVVGASQ